MSAPQQAPPPAGFSAFKPNTWGQLTLIANLRSRLTGLRNAPGATAGSRGDKENGQHAANIPPKMQDLGPLNAGDRRALNQRYALQPNLNVGNFTRSASTPTPGQTPLLLHNLQHQQSLHYKQPHPVAPQRPATPTQPRPSTPTQQRLSTPSSPTYRGRPSSPGAQANPNFAPANITTRLPPVRMGSSGTATPISSSAQIPVLKPPSPGRTLSLGGAAPNAHPWSAAATGASPATSAGRSLSYGGAPPAMRPDQASGPMPWALSAGQQRSVQQGAPGPAAARGGERSILAAVQPRVAASTTSSAAASHAAPPVAVQPPQQQQPAAAPGCMKASLPMLKVRLEQALAAAVAKNPQAFNVPGDDIEGWFDSMMHPGKASKLDGPLPQELPEDVRYGNSWYTACRDWNATNKPCQPYAVPPPPPQQQHPETPSALLVTTSSAPFAADPASAAAAPQEQGVAETPAAAGTLRRSPSWMEEPAMSDACARALDIAHHGLRRVLTPAHSRGSASTLLTRDTQQQSSALSAAASAGHGSVQQAARPELEDTACSRPRAGAVALQVQLPHAAEHGMAGADADTGTPSSGTPASRPVAAAAEAAPTHQAAVASTAGCVAEAAGDAGGSLVTPSTLRAVPMMAVVDGHETPVVPSKVQQASLDDWRSPTPTRPIRPLDPHTAASTAATTPAAGGGGGGGATPGAEAHGAQPPLTPLTACTTPGADDDARSVGARSPISVGKVLDLSAAVLQSPGAAPSAPTAASATALAAGAPAAGGAGAAVAEAADALLLEGAGSNALSAIEAMLASARSCSAAVDAALEAAAPAAAAPPAPPAVLHAPAVAQAAVEVEPEIAWEPFVRAAAEPAAPAEPAALPAAQVPGLAAHAPEPVPLGACSPPPPSSATSASAATQQPQQYVPSPVTLMPNAPQDLPTPVPHFAGAQAAPAAAGGQSGLAAAVVALVASHAPAAHLHDAAGPSTSTAAAAPAPGSIKAVEMQMKEIESGIQKLSVLKQELLADDNTVDAASIAQLITLKMAVDKMVQRTSNTAQTVSAVAAEVGSAAGVPAAGVPVQAAAPVAAPVAPSQQVEGAAGVPAGADTPKRMRRTSSLGALLNRMFSPRAKQLQQEVAQQQGGVGAASPARVLGVLQPSALQQQQHANACGAPGAVPGGSAAGVVLPGAAGTPGQQAMGRPERPSSASAAFRKGAAPDPVAANRRAALHHRAAAALAAAAAEPAPAAAAAPAAAPLATNVGAGRGDVWRRYEEKIAEHRRQMDNTKHQLDDALRKLSDMQSEFDELLLCLGMESAKNKALCDAMRAVGIDPEPILRAVEEAWLDEYDC